LTSSNEESKKDEDSKECEEIPFNIDSLDKVFPSPDQFENVMPMLSDEDSGLLHNLIVDQVFCRFCLLMNLLVDIPGVFSNNSNVSSTVHSTSQKKMLQMKNWRFSLK
jgi:hypothetical protein